MENSQQTTVNANLIRINAFKNKNGSCALPIITVTENFSLKIHSSYNLKFLVLTGTGGEYRYSTNDVIQVLFGVYQVGLEVDSPTDNVSCEIEFK
jgi:hypothetical protein